MKRTIIVILIIGVFAIGAALYLRTLPQFSGQGNKAPVAQDKKTEDKKTIETTLKGLLSSGNSQKCTYSANEASVSGTIYVSGGKVRGDYKTEMEGKKISGHMIVSDGYSYIWSDDNKQGMKMAIDMDQITNEAEKAKKQAESQVPDINQKVNYDCSGWVKDDKLFAVPSDINFASFAVPSSVPSSGENLPESESMCAACDNLPEGQARDACKTQLKCN